MMTFGETLIRQPCRPSNPQNNHDHCEFCWARFASFDGCLHSGYSTPDRYRWICETCFEEHRDAYQWNIIDKIS